MEGPSPQPYKVFAVARDGKFSFFTERRP